MENKYYYMNNVEMNKKKYVFMKMFIFFILVEQYMLYI